MGVSEIDSHCGCQFVLCHRHGCLLVGFGRASTSRVWQRTRAPTESSLASSWWSDERTKTAVLPMPLLAWQSTSMPRIACGMHSCCTSDGLHAEETETQENGWEKGAEEALGSACRIHLVGDAG